MLLHLSIHCGGSVTEEMLKRSALKKKKVYKCSSRNCTVSGARTWRSGYPHLTLGHLAPMPSSRFAYVFFPWSILAFILGLTFRIFPVCHKETSPGARLAPGGLWFHLKTFCSRAGMHSGHKLQGSPARPAEERQAGSQDLLFRSHLPAQVPGSIQCDSGQG